MMKITVCGIHYAKSKELIEAVEVEPKEISVNGRTVSIDVCGECESALNDTLRTLLMAGGLSDSDIDDVGLSVSGHGDYEEEEEIVEGDEYEDMDSDDYDSDDPKEEDVSNVVSIQENETFPEDDLEDLESVKEEISEKKRTPKPAVEEVAPKVIREWAKANGITVGVRGKIRPEVVEAYYKAHG